MMLNRQILASYNNRQEEWDDDAMFNRQKHDTIEKKKMMILCENVCRWTRGVEEGGQLSAPRGN